MDQFPFLKWFLIHKSRAVLKYPLFINLHISKPLPSLRLCPHCPPGKTQVRSTWKGSSGGGVAIGGGASSLGGSSPLQSQTGEQNGTIRLNYAPPPVLAQREGTTAHLCEGPSKTYCSAPLAMPPCIWCMNLVHCAFGTFGASKVHLIAKIRYPKELPETETLRILTLQMLDTFMQIPACA